MYPAGAAAKIQMRQSAAMQVDDPEAGAKVSGPSHLKRPMDKLSNRMRIVFDSIAMRRYNKVRRMPSPQFLQYEEMEIYNFYLDQLREQHRQSDTAFWKMVSNRPVTDQFIFTQQRWAQQMKQAEMLSKKCSFLMGSTAAKPVQSQRDRLRLPVGLYILSPQSGKHYMIAGQTAKTLQGFIYSGNVLTDEIVSAVLCSTDQPFSKLVSAFQVKPVLAIKFYDRDSCDRGVSLCGKQVKERALAEMKLTQSIYSGAESDPVLSRPLHSWLPSPSKNVIRCFEHWESDKHGAYFMAMEYANCGELLEVIVEQMHDPLNAKKKDCIDRISMIPDHAHRQLNIDTYRQALRLKADGASMYIELVRYVFQQMVQAVAVLHHQGVAHMDISLENFVAHFDDDGQFLVKLIDFGRARRMKKKPSVTGAVAWQSGCDAFDFTVSTFPGKLRYMSPEGALFHKYQDADPYDASKEDIYALGVALYVLLVGQMPWDSPFFVVKDAQNPQIGYLNGSRKYPYDLMTMTNINTGQAIEIRVLDANFQQMQTARGFVQKIESNCHTDYFTKSALDLLCTIFERRLSCNELCQHPFVTTKPNMQVVNQVLAQYRDSQQGQLQERRNMAEAQSRNMGVMSDCWLDMEAAVMVADQRDEHCEEIESSYFDQNASPEVMVDEGAAYEYEMSPFVEHGSSLPTVR